MKGIIILLLIAITSIGCNNINDRYELIYDHSKNRVTSSIDYKFSISDLAYIGVDTFETKQVINLSNTAPRPYSRSKFSNSSFTKTELKEFDIIYKENDGFEDLSISKLNKSLEIYYGQNEHNFNLFGNDSIVSFDVMILRNKKKPWIYLSHGHRLRLEILTINNNWVDLNFNPEFPITNCTDHSSIFLHQDEFAAFLVPKFKKQWDTKARFTNGKQTSKSFSFSMNRAVLNEIID